MVRKGYKLLVDTFGEPFLVGIFSGFACLLVDIDHPIALAVGIENARFLHPYYFAFTSGIIFGCFSSVGGLLYKYLLNAHK